MKNIAKLALPLVFLVSGEAQAQEFYWAFQYGMSAPVSDLKTITPGTHFRNVAVDGRYVLNPNTTVGFTLGWSVMNTITGPAEVTNFGNVDVGGTQFRYINSFPVMASIHRYLGAPRGTRPYIGLSAGSRRHPAFPARSRCSPTGRPSPRWLPAACRHWRRRCS